MSSTNELSGRAVGDDLIRQALIHETVHPDAFLARSGAQCALLGFGPPFSKGDSPATARWCVRWLGLGDDRGEREGLALGLTQSGLIEHAH